MLFLENVLALNVFENVFFEFSIFEDFPSSKYDMLTSKIAENRRRWQRQRHTNGEVSRNHIFYAFQTFLNSYKCKKNEVDSKEI